MTSHFKTIVLSVGLAIVSFQGAAFATEQAKEAPPAPVPAQILAAKKVFLANAGADIPWNDSPLFSGRPDRAYNQFYAGMKTLGRYELVGAPADADLLFEIQFLAPPLCGAAAGRPDTFGGTPYDAQFRLEVRDPKTNALLWTFVEHAPWALLQGNRDKNFDQALARIVTDVKGLSVPPAPADEVVKQ